jgi:hypothetical protein
MNYYIKHKESEYSEEVGRVIRTDEVESIYIGKGNNCRCGCGGEYFKPADDPKNTKKVKHFLKKMGSGKYKVSSIENYIFEIVLGERYNTRGRLSHQRVATIYLNQKEEAK